MNKLKDFGFIISGCLATTISLLQPANAVQINIVSESSSFENIGDFSVISGNNTPSSNGQTTQIWSSSNASLGHQQSTTMGTLYQLLSDNGITSTNILVFEFGLNEPNNTNSSVTIQSLDITFNIPAAQGGGTQTFSLDSGEDNSVLVDTYGSAGANTGEAKFQVDLGFDFMQYYSSSSTENLVVDSTIANQESGAEVYYLNALLTQNAQEIPFQFSPTLGLILSGGIFGPLHYLTKRREADKKTGK